MSEYAHLAEKAQRTAPDLQGTEVETTLGFSHRDDRVRIHTFIPAWCRWLLRHPDANIIMLNTAKGPLKVKTVSSQTIDEIYGVKATLPLGYLKLSGRPAGKNRPARCLGKIPEDSLV